MKIFKPIALMLMAAGLAAISNYEQTRAGEDDSFNIERKPGTLWTYTEKTGEAAVSETTTGEDKTTSEWNLNTTKRCTVYFKSEGKDGWNVLAARRDTARELKSYKTGGADLTTDKKKLFEPADAPSMVSGRAGVMGGIAAGAEPGAEEWERAVVNYVRFVDLNNFSVGAKWNGRVIIGGVVCGDYSFVVKPGDEAEKTRLTEGRISAADKQAGTIIEITNIKASWTGESSVPARESFDLFIGRKQVKGEIVTATKIKHRVTRETIVFEILDKKEIAAIDEQIKKYEEAQVLIKKSNLTGQALFSSSREVDAKKVIKAGKLFLAALQIRPEGPAAEFIAPWFWNINCLTSGSIHKAEMGKPMPRLSVAEWRNSKPLTDKDLQGKVVVVETTQVWCGPCMNAVPHLTKLYNDNKETGLVIIALSTIKPTKPTRGKIKFIDDMLRILKPTYPIALDGQFYLFDQEGRVFQRPIHGPILQYKSHSLFPSRGIPHVYVADRKGIVRWEGFPMNPKFDLTIKKLLKEKAE